MTAVEDSLRPQHCARPQARLFEQGLEVYKVSRRRGGVQVSIDSEGRSAMIEPPALTKRSALTSRQA